jgi:hypothetical protein
MKNKTYCKNIARLTSQLAKVLAGSNLGEVIKSRQKIFHICHKFIITYI